MPARLINKIKKMFITFCLLIVCVAAFHAFLSMPPKMAAGQSNLRFNRMAPIPDIDTSRLDSLRKVTAIVKRKQERAAINQEAYLESIKQENDSLFVELVTSLGQ